MTKYVDVELYEKLKSLVKRHSRENSKPLRDYQDTIDLFYKGFYEEMEK